jgi:tyrosyl-tRNA synthetase
VHGQAAAEAAIAASAALFGQGDLALVDAATIAAAVEGLPAADAGPDTTVAQALVDSGLTKGLGESRRAIAQGGVYLNNVPVSDEQATMQGTALASGHAILRRGKKTLAAILIG